MMNFRENIMIKFIVQLLLTLKKNYKSASIFVKKNLPKHVYRIHSIEQDESNTFVAIIQITTTRQVFKIKPEEILMSDQITDCFSQRDIRTLTYLGYLGINSPKYKILAKRLSRHDTHLTFAIQERGKKKPIIKTAMEISSDEKFITGLHQKDAHMIGHTTATEQIIAEKEQMKFLRETLEKNEKINISNNQQDRKLKTT